MSRYRVGFDGHWQENFETEEDAIEWAKGVGETRRTVYVARVRPIGRHTLVAVFPKSNSAEGRRRWRKHRGNYAPW